MNYETAFQHSHLGLANYCVKNKNTLILKMNLVFEQVFNRSNIIWKANSIRHLSQLVLSLIRKINIFWVRLEYILVCINVCFCQLHPCWLLTSCLIIYYNVRRKWLLEKTASLVLRLVCDCQARDIEFEFRVGGKLFSNFSQK